MGLLEEVRAETKRGAARKKAAEQEKAAQEHAVRQTAADRHYQYALDLVPERIKQAAREGKSSVRYNFASSPTQEDWQMAWKYTYELRSGGFVVEPKEYTYSDADINIWDLNLEISW